MTNDDERQHLEALLHIHRKNARIYETQIAQHGLNPPLSLLHGLDHEQHEIELLQTQLQALGFPPRAAGITPLVIQPQELVRRREPELTRSSPFLAQPTRPRRSVPRSAPPFRQMFVRTRAHAVRWWAAGGVAFTLAMLIIVGSLVRPAPNAVLVDRIRSQEPATYSFTLRVTEPGVEPVRLNAVVGDVIALVAVNESQETLRLAIVDAAPDAVPQLFADGFPAHQDTIVRLSPLLGVDEQSSQTFVPFHTGVFSIVSVADTGVPKVRGVIDVR